MGLRKRRRVFTLISPVIVANNFIRKAEAEDINVTPLKLQKLVYFLYREYLKRTNEQLFTERFETWQYGPVVPSIYAEFNSYGKNPVKSYSQDSQGISYVVEEKGIFKECIDFVWKKYKEYTGEELSSMTHESGTAWTIAKNNENQYLSDEDIKNEQA